MTPQTIQLDNETYVLTFQDNFDQTTPRLHEGHGSSGIWNTSFAPHQHDGRYIDRNGESQFYVTSKDSSLPQPFSMPVSGNGIKVSASQLTLAQQAQADNQPYGSGLLTTELSFGLTHGYIEIGAEVPAQQGFLSAFWLLPTSGQWSSEIDVFEILGHDPHHLHTNYWVSGLGHEQSIFCTADLSAGFHTFAVKWTPTEITWYLDGQVQRTVNASLSDEMYLAMSLAVATNWTGPTDATTDFNDPLKVQFVRAYEPETSPTRNLVLDVSTPYQPKTYGATSANETLFGTQWDDSIDGAGGDDTLYGKDGADSLTGGAGTNKLYGGAGDDSLTGGAGNDSLYGGIDADVLDGAGGTDHLWGGTDSATDRFVLRHGMGKDFLHDFDIAADVIDASALSVTWGDIQSALRDRGWATELNLGHFGGSWSDILFLINISAADLTESHFDVGTSV